MVLCSRRVQLDFGFESVGTSRNWWCRLRHARLLVQVRVSQLVDDSRELVPALQQVDKFIKFDGTTPISIGRLHLSAGRMNNLACDRLLA